MGYRLATPQNREVSGLRLSLLEPGKWRGYLREAQEWASPGVGAVEGAVEEEREGGQYPGPHLLTGTSRSSVPANLSNKPPRAFGEGEACV